MAPKIEARVGARYLEALLCLAPRKGPVNGILSERDLVIRALIDREIVDKWVIRIWVRLAGKISQGLQNDEIQLSERIVQPIPAPIPYPQPAKPLIAFIQ